MVMTIPEQHFVGYQKSRVKAKGQDADLPLGFATPYAEDAAGEKRQATVRGWADKGSECHILPNTLAAGFKLSKSVRRHSGWGNGNVVWRIEDPRGFELEISSPNFASIIACTTIENGEIAGRCVWGRDGARNVLLPENSEPYQNARSLTKLAKQSIALKTIEPGDVVRLADGRDVIYFGAYHVLQTDIDRNYVGGGYGSTGYKFKVKLGAVRRRHLYAQYSVPNKNMSLENLLDPQRAPHSTSRWGESEVKAASALKVSEVVVRGAMTICPRAVCNIVNALPANKRKHYFGYSTALLGLSTIPFGAIEPKFADAEQEIARGQCTFVVDGERTLLVERTSVDRFNGRAEPNPDFTLDISSALASPTDAIELPRSYGRADITTMTGLKRTLVLQTAAGDFAVDSISHVY